MSRPTDWSPLQQWEDPVPGDPDEVSAGAETMALVATTISEAAQNLRALGADDGMKSQAVDAFRARALEVAAEIELAKDRYASTGTALAGYVEPLRTAQNWSVEALEEASQARSNLNAADTEVSDLLYQRQAASDEAAQAMVDNDLQDAWSRQAAAQGALDDAFAKLARATGHRDSAAETAMGLIDNALQINDLDDSAWRQFLNKNAEILDTIGTVLGVVAAVLAVVTLFIPGVNLLAIGLVVGLGAAGINFALAENGNGRLLHGRRRARHARCRQVRRAGPEGDARDARRPGGTQPRQCPVTASARRHPAPRPRRQPGPGAPRPPGARGAAVRVPERHDAGPAVRAPRPAVLDERGERERRGQRVGQPSALRRRLRRVPDELLPLGGGPG